MARQHATRNLTPYDNRDGMAKRPGCPCFLCGFLFVGDVLHEIAAAEDAIKAVMGDEELLTAGAYKVSWKTFTSSRLDSTALKKALPEVAAAYTKTTTVRRFSVG